jgi:hypothetical protein
MGSCTQTGDYRYHLEIPGLLPPNARCLSELAYVRNQIEYVTIVRSFWLIVIAFDYLAVIVKKYQSRREPPSRSGIHAIRTVSVLVWLLATES